MVVARIESKNEQIIKYYFNILIMSTATRENKTLI